MAAGKLHAFTDEHLDILLRKGFSTPDMLTTADEDMLTEQPALPPAIRRALLSKYNPDALTASTGESCSTCCARHQMLGGNTWAMEFWLGTQCSTCGAHKHASMPPSCGQMERACYLVMWGTQPFCWHRWELLNILHMTLSARERQRRHLSYVTHDLRGQCAQSEASST